MGYGRNCAFRLQLDIFDPVRLLCVVLLLRLCSLPGVTAHAGVFRPPSKGRLSSRLPLVFSAVCMPSHCQYRVMPCGLGVIAVFQYTPGALPCLLLRGAVMSRPWLQRRGGGLLHQAADIIRCEVRRRDSVMPREAGGLSICPICPIPLIFHESCDR